MTSTAEYQHAAPIEVYVDAMRAAGLTPAEPVDHRPLVAEALRRAAEHPPAVTLAHLMGADFGVMFTNLRAAIGAGLVAPTEIVAAKPE